jgi:epoxide hydrolase-like predicted phosphatase
VAIMTIRAVVFDIGGVLEITPVMDFGPRWEVQLGLSDGALGVGMSDVWSAGEVGEISEAAVYQALRDRLGLTAEILDAVMADMWTQYLGRANDDLFEYVRQLRPRYRTGLLSNSFVGAREREQAAYAFEDLVDDIVYSHEVGMKKPDPRMYALACARLDVEPPEMIFVDNGPRLVAGARECGINAILFENNEQVIAELEALGANS